MNSIHADGRHFVDDEGRIIILRGVNLAGISIPFSPNGATHLRDDFPPDDFKNVSWVGRPFPLSESDEHFTRLRKWGFNCLRMLVSWEAVEHEGPGKFDERYLDYVEDLLEQAGQHGFKVFINFHQDVWSRVTGGDGHPLWLFSKVGLDYKKFHRAGASITMQEDWDADPTLDTYSEFGWNANSRLFPCMTMWTLFWAGNDFAPKLEVQDEVSGEMLNISDYMQDHYIHAVEKVMERLVNQSHVIGLNPINEPSRGYVGLKVSKRPTIQSGNKSKKRAGGIEPEPEPEPGIAWSPLDTMAAAAGNSVKIEKLSYSLRKGIHVSGIVEVNPEKVSIWKDDSTDFWRAHDAWGMESGRPATSNDDYFRNINGRTVNFTEDYLVPFHEKAIMTARKYNKDWLLFMENDPALNGSVRFHQWPAKLPENSVNSFHWYDLIQLGLKKFMWPLNVDLTKMKLVWGMGGIQKMYTRQMRRHVDISTKINGGNCPMLVGEFGISMDMNGGRAFKSWEKKGSKAFKWHEKILNLMYNSLDELQLSSTQWNYASFNRNLFGDMWNLEDLSIYSKDQEMRLQNDLYSGSRGIRGFCRPYPTCIAGSIIKYRFDMKKKNFILKYKPEKNAVGITKVFVPEIHFPRGCRITCHGATYEYKRDEQLINLRNTGDGTVTLFISSLP
ncbi:MAG: cellulase family glycosylhydrolase [Promethearchaeota archaeon]